MSHHITVAKAAIDHHILKQFCVTLQLIKMAHSLEWSLY